jgi:hypothetical protein
MADDDPDVDELRLKRHAILSTALPFPKLDWTDEAKEAESLKLIRDYSESLANSALDWYLHHQKSKKRLAQCLHFVIFLFVALAAIPPLLKLGIPSSLQSACAYCDWVDGHAGEVALVLLGIAGIAKLWDSNAGYTVDWMRFFTTAANINRKLTKFRFDWDTIDLEQRYPPPEGANAGGASTQSSDAARAELRRAPRQLKLAGDFCEDVLTMVDREVEVWADEFKKRYDKAVKHPGQDK